MKSKPFPLHGQSKLVIMSLFTNVSREAESILLYDIFQVGGILPRIRKNDPPQATII